MTLAGLLPDGVDAFTLMALIAFALIASIARGFSGFGGALIFMPLASTVILPRTAAVMLMLVDLVAAAPLIPPAWRHAQRKPVAWMALGALFGVPLGAYALLSFDPLLTMFSLLIAIAGCGTGFHIALRYKNGQLPEAGGAFIGLALAALVLLFYVATLVRLGGNVMNRPL